MFPVQWDLFATAKAFWPFIRLWLEKCKFGVMLLAVFWNWPAYFWDNFIFFRLLRSNFKKIMQETYPCLDIAWQKFVTYAWVCILKKIVSIRILATFVKNIYSFCNVFIKKCNFHIKMRKFLKKFFMQLWIMELQVFVYLLHAEFVHTCDPLFFFFLKFFLQDFI